MIFFFFLLTLSWHGVSFKNKRCCLSVIDEQRSRGFNGVVFHKHSRRGNMRENRIKINFQPLSRVPPSPVYTLNLLWEKYHCFCSSILVNMTKIKMA